MTAFREIYDEHRQFVFRFTYTMVRDQHLAEELTQETFFRAFKSAPSMRSESSIATWLGGIARNVCLSSFRRARRDRTHVLIDDTSVLALKTNEHGPDRVLLDAELNEIIDSALASLPEQRRVAFVLKVIEQLSYDDMAVILGSSVAKLKTDVHRARLEMRRIIGPYLEARE